MNRPRRASSRPDPQPSHEAVRVPSPGIAAPGGESGFSLIEMILVVSLVALLTSVALPRLQPVDFRLDAGLREAAISLNAVQREAVVRQHDMMVTLDTAQLRFDVHHDVNNNHKRDAGEHIRVLQLHDGVGFGAGGAPQIGGHAAPTSFSVHSDLQMPTFVFHRNGSASEEGTIYLTSKGALGAQQAEHGRAVRISRASGRVACFSNKTGSWRELC